MAGTNQRISVRVTVLSGLAALISAMFSGYSSLTAQEALKLSERTNRDAQRSGIFAQFQERYSVISSRFPARLLDPKFRPRRGSDDYARLEAYWFFCFSEWYATNRVNSDALQDLWKDYYRPLIADGLEIPSLRYVLEDRVRTRGPGRDEWRIYLNELAAIARDFDRPLSPEVEARMRKPVA